MYSEQKQALAAELSFKHPAVLAVSGSAGSGKTSAGRAAAGAQSRGLKVGVIREADDLRLPPRPTACMRPVPRVAVFTAGRYLLTEQFRPERAGPAGFVRAPRL